MVQLKGEKIFFGMIMLIFVYTCVFTLAICSFELTGGGHAENDHQPYSHCGVDLNNFVSPVDGSSSLVDLTSHWSLLPPIDELHLPVLCFSVLRVPKTA